MNPLDARKRILLAESELNRAQVVDDFIAMTESARVVVGHAKTFGSVASAAAVLAVGLTAFRRGKSIDAGSKPSRLLTILKCVGLIGTFWLKFRSHGRDRKSERARG